MKDYYKIIGVKISDSADIIKKAYRKLAKQFHPDLHPDDPAIEEKFKEINEAWETLGDTDKRKKYDAERSVTTGQTIGQKPSSSKRKTTTPVGKVDIEEMMKNFSSTFTKEHLEQEADKKKNKGNTIMSDEAFKKFMGIK